ncbi:hypothetical protein FVE67_04785 [Thermosulfurimonas marina]|uniref:DUF5666 domain-containing protein n=1 Tax=Thermosulfurimonas marina TaxID=2047767 RepID=A0A6H1WSF5_9BACT|nr:hypothetical protein [Thermosulfurimonas marina]QJA06155.1 hypothetical protein FVE67_04785 [Thermosulfurimonas marina]
MRSLLAWIIVSLLFSLPWGVKAGAEDGCFRQPVAFKGKVIQVRPPLLVVRNRQKIYFVRLGPLRLWQELGVSLRPGDRVGVRGWLCGEVVLPEVIRYPGGKVRFRDQWGRPLWRRRWWPGPRRRFWHRW